MKNLIIKTLQDSNLLKRVCLRSIKQNQEGYFWLVLKENYYNYNSATKIRECLNSQKLYSVYIYDYDTAGIRQTILNTKNYLK